MCGRYTFFPGEFSDLRLIWKVDEDIPLLKPRYNIAPSQEAPVIVQAEGKRTIELFQWGLIPWWAKETAIGNKMINARAETLAEKPALPLLAFVRINSGSSNRFALHFSLSDLPEAFDQVNPVIRTRADRRSMVIMKAICSPLPLSPPNLHRDSYITEQ